MRVLYVNHTAHVSGGELSLLTLLAALPDSVQALMATPPGRLQAAVEELGIPTTAIAGTAGSLRLHPLHTPRALAELSVAAVQVRRAARRHRAQLVHANSIRAGIVLGLARPTAAATVVHVRDCLPLGPLTSATTAPDRRHRHHGRGQLALHRRLGARGGAGRAPGGGAQPGRPAPLGSRAHRPRAGSRASR